MNNLSTQKERQMVASIHTHGMDCFDSQNNPKDLCNAFVNLGAEGFV